MPDSTFILIGYDCPAGSYPSSVVPIVLDKKEGCYQAVYLDDNLAVTREPVNLGSSLIYFKDLEESTRSSLQSFDFLTHRLFAISKHDIRFYYPQDETIFFTNLLKDRNFAKDNPFVRLSLAECIENTEIFYKELETCDHYIQSNYPEEVYKKIWLQDKDRMQKSLSSKKRETTIDGHLRESYDFLVVKKLVEIPRDYIQVVEHEDTKALWKGVEVKNKIVSAIDGKVKEKFASVRLENVTVRVVAVYSDISRDPFCIATSYRTYPLKAYRPPSLEKIPKGKKIRRKRKKM